MPASLLKSNPISCYLYPHFFVYELRPVCVSYQCIGSFPSAGLHAGISSPRLVGSHTAVYLSSCRGVCSVALMATPPGVFTYDEAHLVSVSKQ